MIWHKFQNYCTFLKLYNTPHPRAEVISRERGGFFYVFCILCFFQHDAFSKRGGRGGGERIRTPVLRGKQIQEQDDSELRLPSVRVKSNHGRCNHAERGHRQANTPAVVTSHPLLSPTYTYMLLIVFHYFYLSQNHVLISIWGAIPRFSWVLVSLVYFLWLALFTVWKQGFIVTRKCWSHEMGWNLIDSVWNNRNILQL